MTLLDNRETNSKLKTAKGYMYTHVYTHKHCTIRLTAIGWLQELIKSKRGWREQCREREVGGERCVREEHNCVTCPQPRRDSLGPHT